MKKIYLYVNIIFLIIVVYVSFTIYNDYKKNESLFLKNTTHFLETVTNLNTKNLNTLSKTIFYMSINIPPMKKIMYEASKTNNPKKLEILRKKLLNLFEEKYIYLKKLGFRQFHFFLPNGKSFLRIHYPPIFGDYLKDERDTYKYVIQFKIPVSAYEEGKLFNGFRNVYPIFYKGKFVGGVELSYSFSAIEEKLQTIPQLSYIFITNEKIAEKKNIHNIKNIYKKSSFENFVYDEATFSSNMLIPLQTIFRINSIISANVIHKLEKGEKFSITFQNPLILNNKIIVITFIPIFNVNKKAVAYIIYYKYGTLIEIIKNKTLLMWVYALIAIILSRFLILIIFKKQEEHKKELERRAYFDALTKVYNRYGFNKHLNELSNKKFSLIFCDIDHFKKINDTYGHDIGDLVLKKVASILKENLRKNDIIGRWGGEEFLILLPDTELEDAKQVAEKLRKIIEKENFNIPQKITCSFGIAEHKENQDIESTIKKADELLYKAKNGGRNKVES